MYYNFLKKNVIFNKKKWVKNVKEEIRKRFFDEASIKMAKDIVSKNEINNVEASHLYALLNGIPASEINKTRGGGGMVYYGLIYRDLKAKRGSYHDVNDVVSAFNKRYRTDISYSDLREAAADNFASEDEKYFSLLNKASDIKEISLDELRDAYGRMLQRYKKLQEEFSLVSFELKRTHAKLNVVTCEKEVLEANKEKMKKVFLNGE